MSLHPQAMRLLELAADMPPLDTMDITEVRLAMASMIELTGPRQELAAVEDAVVDLPTGDVAVRVYRPSLADRLPATAFFHGGGWVSGDLESHDRVCRDIAAESGVAVVAVHYSRAPEHPFPRAYDDALGVVRRLLTDGAEWNIDPDRVAVTGESAGGNLAAVACQQLRHVGSGIKHQALIFPVTDCAGVGQTESYRRFAEGHFLTLRDMEFFVRSYVGDADPADPRLSPLRAPDLSGLPPASVVTAEYDPLRDEGEAYAARLAESGVKAEVRRYAGQVHPFIVFASLVDDARDARAWVARRLREALA